jgi:hypothetical protein
MKHPQHAFAVFVEDEDIQPEGGYWSFHTSPEDAVSEGDRAVVYKFSHMEELETVVRRRKVDA